eukprot:1915956-Rhodomonas_salina.1
MALLHGRRADEDAEAETEREHEPERENAPIRNEEVKRNEEVELGGGMMQVLAAVADPLDAAVGEAVLEQAGFGASSKVAVVRGSLHELRCAVPHSAPHTHPNRQQRQRQQQQHHQREQEEQEQEQKE